MIITNTITTGKILDAEADQIRKIYEDATVRYGFRIIISYFAVNFDRKYPSLKNSHQKFRSSGATTAEDKFEAKRSFQKAMLMQFGQSRSSEIFQMVISFLK